MKEGQKERQKGREDDEEDVNIYWITLRKNKRYWNSMETLDPLFGEVALEDNMDQSQDRIRDDEWVINRNVAKLYFAL
jgi:hypothetical protein